MNRPLLSYGLALILSMGAFATVGCNSDKGSNPPPGDSGATAGGNGAFGESPSRPGSYSGDRYQQNQGGAPATQPAQ